jgi:hypothetical protein
MRRLPVLALPAVLLLAIATPAVAQDYCVAGPANCTGTAVSAAQLQAQLTAAQANGTQDRFFLGPVGFNGAPYAYDSPEPVQIVGSGTGATILSNLASTPAILSISGSADSSVSDLGIDIESTVQHGLRLGQGHGHRIAVTQKAGSIVYAAVGLHDGARLDGANVKTTGTGTHAVGVDAGEGTLTGSTVSSQNVAVSVLGPTAHATLARDTLRAPLTVYAAIGAMSVTDSLLDIRAVGQGSGAALGAFPTTSAPVTVDADRVTIIGDGAASPGMFGAYATAQSGRTSTITVRDTIVEGAGAPLARFAAAGGSATVTAAYVNHADSVPGAPDQGPGALTETHRLNVAPGFTDPAASDFRLRADSALVDAGDPAWSGAAATDLAGAARPADGNSDGVAVQDVGAYEYHRPPPAAMTPPPPRDTTRPRLSRLRVPARFVLGAALPKLGARRKAPAIAFTLSERATVRVQVSRRQARHRMRKLAPVLRFSARAGGNRLRFAGRLSRKVRLAPGSYRATLIAVDAAGNRSRAVTGSFRVVRAEHRAR